MVLSELKYILPELILVGSALLLLIIGALQKNKGFSLQLAMAFIAVLVAVVKECSLFSHKLSYFSNMLYNNDIIVFAKLLILSASLFILIISAAYFRANKEIIKSEYNVLILFALAGMMLMISANNLIALYMGLELQSLALYILASFNRDNIKSSEAGLKYFVLGSLASGLLLFGSSFIYGFGGGSLDFDQIAINIHSGMNLGVLIGLVFVIIALCFKIAAVPFHMWAPDVYQGAPTIVTAFFVSAPKVAMFTLLIRVLCGPFVDSFVQWQQIIVMLSLLSMVVGAIAGLRQNNIKRLLAYSSIGHSGYILMAIATGNIGLASVLIYLAVYLITVIGTFSIIILMGKNHNIKVFSGLGRSNPVIALSLSILMFSMAGIPPTAGFMAKFYVFIAAINSGFYYLAIVGLLSSVIAAFYYLRIIKIAYFDEGQGNIENNSISLKIISVTLAIVSLALLMYFAQIVEFTNHIVTNSNMFKL